MIVEGVEDFPIGLEEAKLVREELMEERVSKRVSLREEEVEKGEEEEEEERPFGFCEY